jgi:hypothetical protein
MKSKAPGKGKPAPFPRVTRKATPAGEITEIDTGLYIHRQTRSAGPIDTSSDPYQPIETTLSRLKQGLQSAIGRKPNWPSHMFEMANDLLIEISEAEDFIKANDTRAAAASCILIGKQFEILRISEVIEPDFAKRRRSVEATRGPRQTASVWNELTRYVQDAQQRGIRMTSGRLYKYYCQKFAGEKPMTRESFDRTYYRKFSRRENPDSKA